MSNDAPVSNRKLALRAPLKVTGTMTEEPFITTGTVIVFDVRSARRVMTGRRSIGVTEGSDGQRLKKLFELS